MPHQPADCHTQLVRPPLKRFGSESASPPGSVTVRRRHISQAESARRGVSGEQYGQKARAKRPCSQVGGSRIVTTLWEVEGWRHGMR
jgi:hypothetical protein